MYLLLKNNSYESSTVISDRYLYVRVKFGHFNFYEKNYENAKYDATFQES